jgi:hypothetical protein
MRLFILLNKVLRGLYSLSTQLVKHQENQYDVVLLDPPTSSKVRKQGNINITIY